MELIVVDDVSEKQLKKFISDSVGDKFQYQFATGEIEQSYTGKPFLISITPKDTYIKIMTSLENGWPFLGSVIEANEYTAMKIRYFEDSLSAFYRWEKGVCVRILYALKDDNWVWYSKGEVQKWEKPSNYKNRLIRNRLTKEMLMNYLTACGYNEIIN
ncbi:MAG: hypothetical protein KA099_02940 [Alphaproteobacteria bacterium]|nr:hypothetical protein [Alphaproteobacteria bacterium]MBP7759299.1 hypothetical protein [Alphaproteobacteria bacterium]MBP7762512.1 hypothetical protein [Alphaproteobacteria bacterium]MBP7904259.1 hypothetical protein [Alphaproteobacteria bacterium]